MRSKRYETTIQALQDDPIIQKMVASTPEGADLDSFNAMMGAINFYRRQGGKVTTHIGGPIEAIKSLV